MIYYYKKKKHLASNFNYPIWLKKQLQKNCVFFPYLIACEKFFTEILKNTEKFKKDYKF